MPLLADACLESVTARQSEPDVVGREQKGGVSQRCFLQPPPGGSKEKGVPPPHNDLRRREVLDRKATRLLLLLRRLQRPRFAAQLSPERGRAREERMSPSQERGRASAASGVKFARGDDSHRFGPFLPSVHLEKQQK